MLVGLGLLRPGHEARQMRDCTYHHRLHAGFVRQLRWGMAVAMAGFGVRVKESRGERLPDSMNP